MKISSCFTKELIRGTINPDVQYKELTISDQFLKEVDDRIEDSACANYNNSVELIKNHKPYFLSDAYLDNAKKIQYCVCNVSLPMQSIDLDNMYLNMGQILFHMCEKNIPIIHSLMYYDIINGVPNNELDKNKYKNISRMVDCKDKDSKELGQQVVKNISVYKNFHMAKDLFWNFLDRNTSAYQVLVKPWYSDEDLIVCANKRKK